VRSLSKFQIRKRVLNLRKQGLSYSQIQKIFNIPKSTLSNWCSNIALSENQKYLLNERRKNLAKKGLIIAAKNKTAQKNKKNEKIYQEAINEIGDLNKRDRFIAGIALYLGDGYKTDLRFGFSNTNPQIISFMMNWLLEFTDVEINKIRGRIWIHDNLDEKIAKKFWGKLLNINQKNFIKSYIVKNKINSKKIRKNVHDYGVFSLIVNNKDLQSKMLAFMTGILSN